MLGKKNPETRLRMNDVQKRTVITSKKKDKKKEDIAYTRINIMKSETSTFRYPLNVRLPCTLFFFYVIVVNVVVDDDDVVVVVVIVIVIIDAGAQCSSVTFYCV